MIVSDYKFEMCLLIWVFCYKVKILVGFNNIDN